MDRRGFLAGGLALAAAPRARAADPVAAARRFRGATIAVTSLPAPYSVELREVYGPRWTKLTGIGVDVVSLSPLDLYRRPFQEHATRSGALDVLELDPAWVPDLADAGVVLPLDRWIARHGYGASLRDLHPTYRALGLHGGRRYAIADDGDVLALFYRRDLFADARLRRLRREPLRVPRSWDEFAEVAQFFTDALAPEVFGTASAARVGGPGNEFAFLQQYRAAGGRLFDPATMRALPDGTLAERTLRQLLAQDAASVPGTSGFDTVAQWTAWLQGKVAMIVSWPSIGRLSENAAKQPDELAFLPASAVAGRVGYAPVPGGRGEAGAGSAKAVAAGSLHAEAAYLFVQWLTSPAVSLERVLAPGSLRDPYRLSHFRSGEYRRLWRGAGAYLDALEGAADGALLDPVLPAARRYEAALDLACATVRARGAAAIPSALRDVRAQWDAITRQVGIPRQRAAYRAFLALRR